MWGAVAKAAADTATSLYNNQQNIHATNLANKQAYERAKEFAQNRIQWTVEDARKAGIHPLAGLGANVSFGAPSVIPADNQLDLSGLGQNISNVIDRFQTQGQRDAEDQKAQDIADWEEEKRQMARDEHKARMAESRANVGLKDAETNRILNPVEKVSLGNKVKRVSWKDGAQPRVPSRPRLKSGREKLTPMEKMGQNREIEGNMEGLLYNSDKDTYVPLPSKARAEMAQNLGWLGHSYDALYHAGSRLGEILGASKRKPFIKDGYLFVYDKWSGEYRRTLPVRGSRRR